MLCKEIIAVRSEIWTKHMNKLCGQNVEFVSVRSGDTSGKQLDHKGPNFVWLYPCIGNAEYGEFIELSSIVTAWRNPCEEKAKCTPDDKRCYSICVYK